jgi:hypothetical protein
MAGAGAQAAAKEAAGLKSCPLSLTCELLLAQADVVALSEQVELALLYDAKLDLAP